MTDKLNWKVDFVDALIVPLCSLIFLAFEYIGLPRVFTFAILYAVSYLYHIRERLSLAWFVKNALFLITRVFFRDIGFRGAHKIPEKGPVIFVCAPHANQFLDPILVMQCTDREIGFLSAAKSMRRKYVGAFARALGSIPVERPQDLAVKGTGTVTIDGKSVTGTGTEFKKQIQPGCSLEIGSQTLPVKEVLSDTALTISAPPESEIKAGSKYKVSPKLDQSQVFDSVFDALGEGRCIGIFPEGGSHDRTDFLPLKAGVTIMALGAMNKYPGLSVTIMPVGLNYFNGHRFRSRAYLDIGEPIVIDQSLVAKYKEGKESKRVACETLLNNIHTALKGCTVTAPDIATLELIWAVRGLYKPSGMRLNTEQTVELTRRLELGYEKLKDDPRIQNLLSEVRHYQEQLRHHGLKDHQVKTTAIGGPRALFRLIWRSLLLLTYAVLALPGFILNSPVLLVARNVSKKKAVEAKAGSAVKIEGRDVMATWKVMTAMILVPLMFVIYPLLAALVGWLAGWGALQAWAYFALFQPIAMYGSVRIVEIGLEIIRSLRPLFLSLGAKQDGFALRTERANLKSKVRGLVEAFGPQLFGADWDKNRIIRPDQIRRMSKSGATGVHTATVVPIIDEKTQSPSSASISSSSGTPSPVMAPVSPTSPANNKSEPLADPKESKGQQDTGSGANSPVHREPSPGAQDKDKEKENGGEWTMVEATRSAGNSPQLQNKSLAENKQEQQQDGGDASSAVNVPGSTDGAQAGVASETQQA